MFRRKAAVALLAYSLLLPNFAALAQQPAPTPTPTPAAAQATPTPSNDPVERIKEEGLKRSQVMETLGHLTEVIGPRLTGSPALKRANEWTRDRLASWGLQNARLEPWGPFGRGWTLRRFSAEVTEPVPFPLVAYPKAWSPGTDGPVTADVVLVEATTEEELQKYKGRLKGAIVLVGQVRETKPRFDPVAKRLTDKELLDLANAPDPSLTPRRPRPQQSPEEIARARFNNRKTHFYYEEGAALLVDSSRGGDGGSLQFVQQASVLLPFEPPADARRFPWLRDAPRMLPQVSLSNDHYNRVARMIQKGQRVRMTVNLAVEFQDEDMMAYNTVAEIPGTDLKDEVVMLGAHLDSWHMATGATDNAAGVAVMMEAVRILQALNLRPRRTVRIALWTGEEQGLLGSRAYVREHFGPVPAPSPAAGQPAPAPVYKPEHEKFYAYYNMDSGTGKIRGIYLQGNEALRPIFRRWLAPLRDLGADTITLANAGGSDFLAFDAAGLVGLDFLQDEIEYGPRTWHSNQDTLDRVIADDVKQAAVVVAAFVYNSAVGDGRLPRKPARPAATPQR